MRPLLPAVRTFMSVINKWHEVDRESITRILETLQTILGHRNCYNLLGQLASDLWKPLMQMYSDEALTLEIRLYSVSLLGDICALPSNEFCNQILRAGLCE